MPAFSGRVPRKEPVSAQPAPAPQAEQAPAPIAEAPKPEKKRRSRHSDGTYVGDNPATPQNEAWTGGEEGADPFDALYPSEAKSDG